MQQQNPQRLSANQSSGLVQAQQPLNGGSPLLVTRSNQVYRITLRSDQRDLARGGQHDAYYSLNWSVPLDQDKAYMIILDSLHVQEPAPGNSGYADQILVAELGQAATNVYDTLHGRSCGTLAAWKGLSYSSAPHMAGVNINTPVWQQGDINLKISTVEGDAATGLEDCVYVATLLLYPTN